MYKKDYVDDNKSGYIMDVHTILKYAIDINEVD
jgi:hypothetical protein